MRFNKIRKIRYPKLKRNFIYHSRHVKRLGRRMRSRLGLIRRR